MALSLIIARRSLNALIGVIAVIFNTVLLNHSLPMAPPMPVVVTRVREWVIGPAVGFTEFFANGFSTMIR